MPARSTRSPRACCLSASGRPRVWRPSSPSHDKHYRVSIAFGAATDTDDAAGTVTRTGVVPAKALDRRFAEEFVAGLVGKHRQMPPVYSAIKVGGVKACDAARKGTHHRPCAARHRSV